MLAQQTKEDARCAFMRILRTLPYGNATFFAVRRIGELPLRAAGHFNGVRGRQHNGGTLLTAVAVEQQLMLIGCAFAFDDADANLLLQRTPLACCLQG